jgi:hypothetical protein
MAGFLAACYWFYNFYYIDDREKWTEGNFWPILCRRYSRKWLDPVVYVIVDDFILGIGYQKVYPPVDYFPGLERNIHLTVNDRVDSFTARFLSVFMAGNRGSFSMVRLLHAMAQVKWQWPSFVVYSTILRRHLSLRILAHLPVELIFVLLR